MNEQVAWAKLKSVSTKITSISWLDEAYMYLEFVPQHFLDKQEQEASICIDHYNPETSFDSWQRGRIFDAQHELKWEWRNDQFHTVYCGQHVPPDFTTVHLDAARDQIQTYYLWGERVKKDDLGLLGLHSDSQVFVELQIPRILRYPVTLQGRGRVCAVVHEWYAADGSLCYSRWCRLEAEGKNQ